MLAFLSARLLNRRGVVLHNNFVPCDFADNQLNKKVIKSVDEIKNEDDDKSCSKDGSKLKKLTWQSSITNGNKMESVITGPRVMY